MSTLVVNIVLASGLVYVLVENRTLQSHLLQAVQDGDKMTKDYYGLKQEHELLQMQLDYYKQQADYYSRNSGSQQAGAGLIGRSSINIVAVSQVETNLFETSYVGTVMVAEVELRRGEGRVLVNTVPRIGIDLQTSGRTAVLIAQNVTGVSLDRTDVILTVKAKSIVDVVDGPSAGAAVTLAMIAAIWNHTLNRSVYMTGTVNTDGTVGAVGGIPYKALAAAQEGATTFIVPKGQSLVTKMVARESQPIPGLTLVRYEQVQVKLSDFLKQEGYNIRVVEVVGILEAYNTFRFG